MATLPLLKIFSLVAILTKCKWICSIKSCNIKCWCSFHLSCIGNAIDCELPNEEFLSCGSECPESCCNYNLNYTCSSNCVSGCFCEPGYVRDLYGKCVNPRKCGVGMFFCLNIASLHFFQIFNRYCSNFRFTHTELQCEWRSPIDESRMWKDLFWWYQFCIFFRKSVPLRSRVCQRCEGTVHFEWVLSAYVFSLYCLYILKLVL